MNLKSLVNRIFNNHIEIWKRLLLNSDVRLQIVPVKNLTLQSKKKQNFNS